MTAKAPPTTVKNIQSGLKPTVWPTAKRTKVRYGPYRIPGITERNVQSLAIHNTTGMLDTLEVNVQKPTLGDFVLMSLHAGLEYVDGSNANTDTGSWLHHTVLLNAGPDIVDPNCGLGPIEDIMMSGNERTYVAFAPANTTLKTGYHVKANDKFIISNELMNMDKEEKWVWMTIDYEYHNKPEIVAKYAKSKMVWLAVRMNCQDNPNLWGQSNITAKGIPTKAVFSEASVPWKSSIEGTILVSGGHMHE